MYAIMRTKKHKDGGGLKAALMHLNREKKTPNANPEIANTNLIDDVPPETSKNIQRLERKKKEVGKVRKNAVVVVEYLMTASPDFFDGDDENELDEETKKKRISDFEKASMEWLREQYPDGEIIAAQVHLDETTPHVSAFVTPTIRKKNGEVKFDARSILGNRQLLRDHQTSFADKMKPLGLKRGVERSMATHKQVSKFYTEGKQAAKRAENFVEKAEEEITKAPVDEHARIAFKYAKKAGELAAYALTREQPTVVAALEKKFEEEIEKLKADFAGKEKEIKSKYETIIETLKIEHSKTHSSLLAAQSTLEMKNTEIADLQQTNNNKNLTIKDLDHNLKISNNLALALGAELNESNGETKAIVSKFFDDAQYRHLETMVEKNIIAYEDLTESSQDILDNYQRSEAYTR